MRALIASTLALCLLSACTVVEAETPAQKAFALSSEYAAALTVAEGYEALPRCTAGVETPCSDPDTVERIRKADKLAYAAVSAAQNFVRDHPGDKAGIVGALAAANLALSEFRAVLSDKVTGD